MRPRQTVHPSEDGIDEVRIRLGTGVFRMRTIEIIAHDNVFRPFRENELVGRDRRFKNDAQRLLLFVSCRGDFLDEFHITESHERILPNLFIIDFQAVIAIGFHSPEQIVNMVLTRSLRGQNSFQD